MRWCHIAQLMCAGRYSWGACLAASAIHLPSVHGYLGISPPVGEHAAFTAFNMLLVHYWTAPPAWGWVPACQAVLCAVGDNVSTLQTHPPRRPASVHACVQDMARIVAAAFTACSCCAGWLSSFALRSKRHFGAAQQAVAHKPCQLLIGTRDQFTSAFTIIKWVEGFNRTLAGTAVDAGSPALQLSVVESASHFWETRQARQELSEAIDSFINSLCGRPACTLAPA